MKKLVSRFIAALVMAVSLTAIAQNIGFEDGNSTGWTGNGISAVGSQTLHAGSNTWTINPYGSYMGKLTITSGSFSQMTSALNLTTASASGIKTTLTTQAQTTGNGGGNPTSAAWTSKTVTLTAGQTFTLAWQYISTDYIPYNDGSIATLVKVGSPSTTAVLNNYTSQYALLGFTNPGTGDYSTGSYGATGWQTATYTVTESGDYLLGFGVFNLDDYALSPVLYVDEVTGTTLKNGTTFGAVAPNPGTSAPNASGGSVTPTPTPTPTPTLVSNVTGTTGSDMLAAGSITVNGGTIQIMMSGATLTQLFDVQSGGMTIDQNSKSATLSGVISGTGNVVIANSGSGGSIIFTAVNTYTGSTTINSGATLNNQGSIASSSGVTNAGTFINSGTAGDLTNSGTATNSGTLGDVTNSNFFSNLLNGIINSLTNSGTASNAGTITTTVNNIGTFDNTGTTGDVTNSGTATNSGTVGSVNNTAGTFTNTGTAGNISNAGTVNNSGTADAVANTGFFTNLINGIINSLMNSGTASNAGTITTTVNNIGTFDNTGTTGDVTNSGTATNSGTVGSVNNTAGTFTNTGTAGDITNSGSFNNQGSAGNVINTNLFSNLGTTGTVDNSGVFANGGTTGDVTNSGIFDNIGKTGAVTNSGLFTVGAGGSVGSINNSGTFNISGAGTPVRLGSYTQTASGVTVMSLAPGTIQQMTVAGVANLNGAIAFNAEAGPYKYGVYNFLTAQQVNGQYSLLGLLPNDTISPLGFGLVYTGTTAGLKITPSAAYTLASIDRNVSAISGINNLQMATLDGSLNYDCTLYGEKNMCVSTGIRYVKDASGDLSGANITLGYKINSKFRVGLFTDKGFNNLTIGNVTQKAGTPILGGYANWSEDARGYGWGVRASAAVTSAKMDVTRQASAWSEAGTGTSNVTGQAYQIKGTYTLPIGTRLTLAPYVGLRHTTLSNSGFTESGAQYPLTYNSLTQTTTDAMTGLGVGYNFGRATAFVSAGVIRNLSYSAGAVSGSSDIINLSSYNIAIPGSNYTSLGVGAGFTYDVAKNQYLTTSFGWQQKSLINTSVSNFGINYMIGY
jgi:hypothetical protein